MDYLVLLTAGSRIAREPHNSHLTDILRHPDCHEAWCGAGRGGVWTENAETRTGAGRQARAQSESADNNWHQDGGTAGDINENKCIFSSSMTAMTQILRHVT